MAAGVGYSKVTTNGLIFAYDTGDTRNSWIGQPGTNITTGVGRSYNGYSMTTYSPGVFFETNGFTETVNIPALGPTVVQSIFINNSSPGVNCCPNLFNYTGGWMSPIWSGNTTYTYQIIYKSLSGYTHPNFMYRYEYNSSGGYLTEVGVFTTSQQESLGDGWFHAWNTFTTQPTAALGYTGLWYYQYNTPDIISIAAISIVPGNTIRPARQLIPSGTTRSNTQGLLDLSGTGTLTLNTSYNSNAQIVFDGTDDHIIDSNNIPHGTNDFSYFAVLRLQGKPSLGTIFENGSWTSCLLIRYETDGITIFSMGGYWGKFSFNPPLNTWYHLGFVRRGNTIFFYVNGVNTASIGFTANVIPSANLYIGMSQHAFGQCFNGSINVASVYTRGLTDGEVLDHYNHYKTRFGLP